MSKLNPEIDPTCRLCLQANETLHHLMTDCEATSSLQLDIMKNQIPLPDMTWSVKDINKFIQHPLIHSLMTYDTQYNNREIEYINHNYSSDASSLWVDPLKLSRRGSGRRVALGHMGGLTNPRPWRGRCRAGYSNTGEPPLPRKRAPLQKNLIYYCKTYISGR